MRSLFDVNALIALLDPDHIRHDAAHAWWSVNSAPGWATCPITQNGFIRSTAQQGYPAQLSIAEALQRLSRETQRPDHEFWPDDISLLNAERIDSRHLLGRKQISDVYLLTLAVRHGGRLVTLDKAIPLAAVKSANTGHLVVL
jgi:toxin-antitoxin system PIN domain toxin